MGKVKIEIKSWFTGSVLFEYETDGNTIKKTVEEAIKLNANLSYANLRSANLYSANLRSANLSSADLSSADLSSANLSYANLRSANLSSANLSSANLCSANLYSANLRSANLSSADLSSADLSSANLSYANLRSANLSSANLSSANLCSANLSYANLRSANLSSADLCSANLYSANLRSANLRSADLCSANIYSANLIYTDLSSAKNVKYASAITTILPDGDIIGWKKCKDGLVVKVRVPEDARRSNATGRKCRAEYVDVLEIIDMSDKMKKPREAVSYHDENTVYRVGERVVCDHWDENRFNECSGGIHFFITRYEAEQY